MGASLDHTLCLSLGLKGIFPRNKIRCKLCGPIWSKSLEAQHRRRGQGREVQWRSKRYRRILMGRNALLEGSRRPTRGIDTKVRTLKKLIPNGESMGLDGLLRETAHYILSLQIRVNIMQNMVKVLSGSDE